MKTVLENPRSICLTTIVKRLHLCNFVDRNMLKPVQKPIERGDSRQQIVHDLTVRELGNNVGPGVLRAKPIRSETGADSTSTAEPRTRTLHAE